MSLLKRLEARKKSEPGPGTKERPGIVVAPPRLDPYQNLKTQIHKRIVDDLSAEESKILTDKEADRRVLENLVARLANTLMDGESVPVPRAERARIITEVVDEVLGYGPIEPLLQDETISEVMVNSPNQVYVER
jgi:pilus assembly protein CpaF